MRELFIVVMLNPSHKSPFMQEFSRFSRILAGLLRKNIWPLDNKKRYKK